VQRVKLQPLNSPSEAMRLNCQSALRPTLSMDQNVL